MTADQYEPATDAYEIAGGPRHFTLRHKQGGRVCHFLGGVVERIEYDVTERVGTMHVVIICNMYPTIGLFQRIDPGVREIRTFIKGEPDTIYRLEIGGWNAYEPV